MRQTSTGSVADLLSSRRPGYSLPGPFYTGEAAFEADLDHIWHREWVLAGAEAELTAPGAFLTLTVGRYPLIVVRGLDGVLRALHNVCRHRGAQLCSEPAGRITRTLVCPYHQWAYRLDGALHRARAMPPDLPTGDPDGELSLGSAHCVSIGGLVFVCVADTPPDAAPLRALVEPYLAPFDLGSARVAHSVAIVEQGNWKLVMENNRECYHCRASHPELCRTFPEAPLHSGGGSPEEARATAELVARCQAAGLPSEFLSSDDNAYRVMRMALLDGAAAMTLNGKPAVAQRFPATSLVPNGDVGDLLLYHYPSTWNHVQADHAVLFRLLPLTPTTSELRTTWLVPGEAVEGMDYDLTTLTEVWLTTNGQDAALVERTQRGVTSPAYRPGPYAPVEEEGVIQFIDWYCRLLSTRLEETP